ncbi:MAG: hypothetical protein WAN99_09415 [Methanoculleus sp.]
MPLPQKSKQPVSRSLQHGDILKFVPDGQETGIRQRLSARPEEIA